MKITAGVDVDIWCTKCRANTAGTVVAMVGSEIAQVTCKICGSGPKKYRPAQGKRAVGAAAEAKPRAAAKEKKPKAAAASSTGPKAKKSSTALSAAADLALWQSRRDAVEGNPDRYDLSRTYVEGEALRHPKWGLGFVESAKPDGRMQVLFEDGRKLLVMSYKK